MATKTLNTRIKLRVDSLENWKNSSVKLMPGEVAFATVAATAGNALEEPVVMMKVGTPDENGEDQTFSQLPWSFYAKASDVLEVAKDAEKLTAFVNDIITGSGLATDKGLSDLVARVEAAEGKITTLEGEMDAVEAKAAANESAITALNGLVGDSKVETQISDAIAALELAKNYEVKGAAAEVQTALDTYKTANDAAVQKNATDIAGEIARAKSAEEGNAAAIEAMKGGTTIDSFGDVEAELAKYQLVGDYATKVEAQGYANAKDAAIEAAHKAGTDAQAAAEAAQAKADAVGQLVGDTAVETQIGDAIDGLADVYETQEAAAAKLEEAKGHATGLNTAMDARVQVVEGKAHTHSFVEAELNKIADGDVAKWNAAEQNAKDYADGLDEAMDARVLALEGKFTGEDSVADQIADAVAGEAALREAADKVNADAIAALEGTHATDKAALEGAIEALGELVGDDKVEDQISAAITVEKERAEAAELALGGRIDAVEATHAADKKDLQDQINLIMDNPDTDKVINSISEFTQYIEDHGTIADGFRTDIDANADAIEAVEGRMDTAEGKISALEEASATHATQAGLETLAGKVTTVEGKVATLEGEMDAAEAAIGALEELVGDDKVEDQIAAAVEVEKERAMAAEKVNADAIDALEAKAPTWDAAVQTVTAGTGLKATKTGTDMAIAFDDEVVFVFDCGGASV